MEAEIERTTVTHHGVEDGQELAHGGDQGVFSVPAASRRR
jgi:hypothetical protein